MSSAMEAAIHQTLARRKRQEKFNSQNRITPKTIMKAKPIMGSEVEDLLVGAAGKGKKGGRRLVGKKPGKKGIEALVNKFGLGAGAWNSTDSVLENISQPEWVEAAYDVIDEDNVEDIAINEGERTKLIQRLEKEMKQAAARLDFERAASLRDRIFQIRTVE